jgi:hypothetical protein
MFYLRIRSIPDFLILGFDSILGIVPGLQRIKMDHKLKNNSKTMSYVYLAVQRNPPKSDILLHVE